jgi:ankyrin repeat protein
MRALLVVLFFCVSGGAWPQAAISPEERLFTAITEGKEIVAEGVLVRGNVNLNARNEHGETPLHRAVEKGMRELVAALVKGGANVNARSGSGETALHLAAMHTDPAPTLFLLRSGADAKARNDEGESPLHWAALSGNAEVANLLLEHGADANLVDLKGNRPLHAAADSGNMQLVRLILSRSTDPKARNREGLTAEDVANERSRPDVAAVLSKAQAQPPSASGTTNFRTIDVDQQPKERF